MTDSSIGKILMHKYSLQVEKGLGMRRIDWNRLVEVYLSVWILLLLKEDKTTKEVDHILLNVSVRVPHYMLV